MLPFWQVDRSVEWNARRQGTGIRLVFQTSDGNLVLRNNCGIVWETDCIGTPGRVAMQDDGNLVVYDAEYNPLWSSKAPYCLQKLG